MEALLRSDLYRAFLPRRLRGWATWHVLVIALLTCLSLGMCWLFSPGAAWLREVLAAQGLHVEGAEASFASPVELWQSSFGGGSFLAILCCLGMIHHVLSDFKDGYVKSLLPGVRGRTSYVLARVAFAGVLSAALLGTGVIVSGVGAAVLGLRVDTGNLGQAVLWLALAWPSLWAMCVVSGAVAYLLRHTAVPAYVMGFAVATSCVSTLVAGLGEAAPGAFLGFLAPFRDVFYTLAQWMPSSVFWSVTTSTSMLELPAVGLVAVPGGYVAQAALTCLIWLVGVGALLVATMRRADVA